jgi:hypothetical protein
LLLTPAVFATCSSPDGLSSQLNQRRSPMSGHKNYVAATSTVAAIRSTEGIELFTQKATAAVAAGSA